MFSTCAWGCRIFSLCEVWDWLKDNLESFNMAAVEGSLRVTCQSSASWRMEALWLRVLIFYWPNGTRKANYSTCVYGWSSGLHDPGTLVYSESCRAIRRQSQASIWQHTTKFNLQLYLYMYTCLQIEAIPTNMFFLCYMFPETFPN